MGGVEFIGRVVSNRMQKTVVVAVSYVVWIPKYKVYQRRVARHKARDEDQTSVVGDVVRIKHSRKFAKHVSYKVVQTLRKASSYDPSAAAALVAERDAARPASWVEAARGRLSGAEERLKSLRRMYDEQIGEGVSLSGNVLALNNSGPVGTGSLAGAAAGKAAEGRAAEAATAAASSSGK